jgi:hypothetical protein
VQSDAKRILSIMGLSVRTGAGGHLVDLGEGNLEP